MPRSLFAFFAVLTTAFLVFIVPVLCLLLLLSLAVLSFWPVIIPVLPFLVFTTAVSCSLMLLAACIVYQFFLPQAKSFVGSRAFFLLPFHALFIAVVVSIFSFWWSLALGAVLFVQGEVDFNTLRPNARWQACIEQFDRWSWPIFSYFPISVFNDGNKDPNKDLNPKEPKYIFNDGNKDPNNDQPKYIFCYHPHGIYALGLFSLVFQRASGFQQQFSPQRPREGMLVAVASALLHVPLLGRLFSWFGFIPASRASLNAACETRNDLVIVPGGIAEMTLIQQKGIELVYLLKRKGFIKLAVKHGRPLVPVYCFGETKIFHQYRFFENTRHWLSRKLKISIVFFRGRNCTLVPRQVPLNVVVGEPIHVTQSDAPSDTYIDQIHGQYVDRLTELFDKYKSQHPEYQNSRLKIV